MSETVYHCVLLREDLLEMVQEVGDYSDEPRFRDCSTVCPGCGEERDEFQLNGEYDGPEPDSVGISVDEEGEPELVCGECRVECPSR